MKKVSILLIVIIIFLINFASGLPVHFEVSKEVFENLYNNFIISFPDANTSKEELKREFTRGAIFPDLYRLYKDGILLDNDWVIANIVPYIDYDLSFYLQREKMIEYGEIENELIIAFGKNSDIPDLHEQGASLLFFLLNNSQYFKTDENASIKKLFHTMGVYSHLLEDMYADLMWVGYLSDYYGFGDFTDPKLYWEELFPSFYSYDPNIYNCLDAPATFFDGLISLDYSLLYLIQGGIDLNNADSYRYDIDDEIFDDVFVTNYDDQLLSWINLIWSGKICGIFDIMFRNKIVNSYFNKSQAVNVDENIHYQTRALAEIINIFKYHLNSLELSYSMIPSVLYNEYNKSDFDQAIKMNKSVWNAQTDKGLNECVKKSLISQLYNKEGLGYNIPNLAYLQSKYVSVPEIMIYDVQYILKLNGDELLIYDPNNEKHIKNYMYAIPKMKDYDELKISIDLYSPIYSAENLKQYLENSIQIGSFDKIEIKMTLKGSDLYGNEYVIKEQNYNVEVDELSLNECLIEGRRKVTTTISKNDISTYYSIWPELSVKPINSEEFKIFYTVNTKDFYEGRWGRCLDSLLLVTNRL